LTDVWINATGMVTWDLTGAIFLGDYVDLEFDFNSLFYIEHKHMVLGHHKDLYKYIQNVR
jgi:hypothetical protein